MQFIKQHLRWILAVWIAFVFIQSLFFKFSNSPETVHIFGVLGEWAGLPWFAAYGGYGVGVAEMIASIILFTRWWPWGALFAFEIMVGAIVFHLFTPLGIVMPKFNEAGVMVGDDGGTLFILACLTCLASAALVVKDWNAEHSQIRSLLKRINPAPAA